MTWFDENKNKNLDAIRTELLLTTAEEALDYPPVYFPQDFEEMKEGIEKLRKEKKELEEDKALLLAENRRLREANTALRATVKRRR